METVWNYIIVIEVLKLFRLSVIDVDLVRQDGGDEGGEIGEHEASEQEAGHLAEEEQGEVEQEARGPPEESEREDGLPSYLQALAEEGRGDEAWQHMGYNPWDLKYNQCNLKYNLWYLRYTIVIEDITLEI